MRVVRSIAALAVTATIGLVAPMAALGQEQTVVAHSVSVSEDGSSLELELTSGERITIELADGSITINGSRAGRYAAGGELEESWRSLLSHGGRLGTAELVEALQAWEVEGLADAEIDIREALEVSLGDLDVVIGSAIATAVSAAQAAVSAQAEAELAQGITEGIAEAQALAEALAVRGQTRQDATIDLSQGIVIDLNSLRGDRSVARQIEQLRERGELDGAGIQVRNGTIHIGDLTVRRGQTLDGNLAVLSGDVSVFGRVDGNLAVIDGDVILRANGRIAGDVLMVNGRVTRAGGHIAGRVASVSGELRVAGRSLRNAGRRVSRPPRVTSVPTFRNASGIELVGQNIGMLLGFFVALACIGFGMSFFMPRQLEVVSETLSDSFGKSFLAGLFAQPLVLPLAVMLIAGLAITIVGIPLAILVALGLPLAVMGAAVMGYLAAAKSVGNSYLIRRMAEGRAVGATPYRATVYGLIGLLAIWTPAVMLGWIPLVGQLFFLLAFAITWVMATAGVGAAILSRAGLRATFARQRNQPALTDEHYWPVDASNFTPARRGRSGR